MAPLQTTVGRPESPGTSRVIRRATSSLARYADSNGCDREIVRIPGAHGSALVIDRLADGLGDERLVAHLCADEPLENAKIVCSLYLSDARGRHCRALTDDDLHGEPPGWVAEEQTSDDRPEVRHHRPLVDPQGFAYQLAVQSPGGVRELRWLCRAPDGSLEPTTLRHVIGALQSYEPARTLTADAFQKHHCDGQISVISLRAELDRIASSHVVLNCGLREAVLAAVHRKGTTLSEIAIRCGRIKRDEHGKETGETSWLARRIGMLPEGGRENPTPWVSSEVLALIAREGLGLAPREVEVR
jgi:hypothetical protein